MPFLRYPDLPHLISLSQDDAMRLKEWWGGVVTEFVERDKNALFGPANTPSQTIILTSVSLVYTYNPTTATATQTSQVLGTLLYFLQNSGRIS